MIPAGWKLVPIFATKAMRSASGLAQGEFNRLGQAWFAGDAWTPMVKAAPEYQPEPWSGEGLPTSKTVCEVTTPAMDGTRIKVTIKYVGETRIIAHDGQGERCWLISNCTFYPIRTAEQIAADAREQLIRGAITAIKQKVENYNCSLDCSAAIRATVEAMIDAGYCEQATPAPSEDTSDIDFSIKPGDMVQKDSWEHGPIEVIDVNWALRAVAVRLTPGAGIVVWSPHGMKKVTP